MLVVCVLGRLFTSMPVIREKHKKDAKKIDLQKNGLKRI